MSSEEGGDVRFEVIDAAEAPRPRMGHGFGKRLRALREAAGLTAWQVAARAGVGRTAVTRHELGERVPTRAHALAIAAAVTGDAAQANALAALAGYLPDDPLAPPVAALLGVPAARAELAALIARHLGNGGAEGAGA